MEYLIRYKSNSANASALKRLIHCCTCSNHRLGRGLQAWVARLWIVYRLSLWRWYSFSILTLWLWHPFLCTLDTALALVCCMQIDSWDDFDIFGIDKISKGQTLQLVCMVLLEELQLLESLKLDREKMNKFLQVSSFFHSAPIVRVIPIGCLTAWSFLAGNWKIVQAESLP